VIRHLFTSRSPFTGHLASPHLCAPHSTPKHPPVPPYLHKNLGALLLPSPTSIPTAAHPLASHRAHLVHKVVSSTNPIQNRFILTATPPHSPHAAHLAQKVAPAFRTDLSDQFPSPSLRTHYQPTTENLTSRAPFSPSHVHFAQKVPSAGNKPPLPLFSSLAHFAQKLGGTNSFYPAASVSRTDQTIETP
jgi:hypothetical protein